MGAQPSRSHDYKLVALVPQRKKMAIEQSMERGSKCYSVRNVIRSKLRLSSSPNVCGLNEAVDTVSRQPRYSTSPSVGRQYVLSESVTPPEPSDKLSKADVAHPRPKRFLTSCRQGIPRYLSGSQSEDILDLIHSEVPHCSSSGCRVPLTTSGEVPKPSFDRLPVDLPGNRTFKTTHRFMEVHSVDGCRHRGVPAGGTA